MAEIKNENSQNLKSADAKKTSSQGPQSPNFGSEFFSSKKVSDKNAGANGLKTRKIPLIIDIIIGVLLIALAGAIIVGSYLLFRYYSNDYSGVKVEYVVVWGNAGEFPDHTQIENKDLYLDVNGNSEYFGNISGIEKRDGSSSANEDEFLLTVSSTLKYRAGEGYSIGDNRLAVGSEFVLRCEDKLLEVTVVELIKISGGEG